MDNLSTETNQQAGEFAKATLFYKVLTVSLVAVILSYLSYAINIPYTNHYNLFETVFRVFVYLLPLVVPYLLVENNLRGGSLCFMLVLVPSFFLMFSTSEGNGWDLLFLPFMYGVQFLLLLGITKIKNTLISLATLFVVSQFFVIQYAALIDLQKFATVVVVVGLSYYFIKVAVNKAPTKTLITLAGIFFVVVLSLLLLKVNERYSQFKAEISCGNERNTLRGESRI